MADQDVLFNIEDSSSSDGENIDIEQTPTNPNILNENNLDFIDLDDLSEFPWRKPGADITDYFNYGFDEKTWRDYCKRQREGKWGRRRDDKRDEHRD
ncbi:Polyadenylation factor I complex, subunit FIP1 [Pseudoloma neurophilia]|uniref:Polyadenylation factor I complex, subunit FIP1 n=1 Tax=Pseudoloma neurophilia TaxID=146866 RepID=A0A0R0M7Q6_9MICR|nr:Polyadenylation factor I complex, subunit FIP1 [Pseudoloma neurophilia]